MKKKIIILVNDNLKFLIKYVGNTCLCHNQLNTLIAIFFENILYYLYNLIRITIYINIVCIFFISSIYFFAPLLILTVCIKERIFFYILLNFINLFKKILKN